MNIEGEGVNVKGYDEHAAKIEKRASRGLFSSFMSSKIGKGAILGTVAGAAYGIKKGYDEKNSPSTGYLASNALDYGAIGAIGGGIAFGAGRLATGIWSGARNIGKKAQSAPRGTRGTRGTSGSQVNAIRSKLQENWK